MDKSSLLDLLRLSSQTVAEGGWAGSCDTKAPAPFGKRSWQSVKAFDEAIMDRWFEDLKTKQKRASKASAIKLHRRLSQQSIKACKTRGRSPIALYEDHLVQTHGPSLGRALARGTATTAPGVTIGERPQTQESKDYVRENKLHLRRLILPSIDDPHTSVV